MKLNLLGNRVTKGQTSINFYFVFSVIVILGILTARYPSLTTHAELWAETGENYLQNALAKTFFENLFIADAGYQTWLPRLITVILVKFFGCVEKFPGVAQYTALSLISVFVSFINLKNFRKLVPSDLIRFVFGLISGLHFGYGMYVFNNFAYFGVFSASFFLILDWRKFSVLWRLVFTILLALSITTKPYFISFLPVFIGLCGFHFYKKRYSVAIILIPSIIALGFQLYNVVQNRSNFVNPETNPLENIFTLASSVFFIIIFGLEQLFLGTELPAFPSFAIGIAIFIIVVIGVVNLFRKKDFFRAMFAISLFFMAAFSSAMTIAAFYDGSFGYETKPTFLDDSHQFFMLAFLLIVGLVIITRFVRSYMIQFVLFLLIAWNSATFGFLWNSEAKAEDPFSDSFKSYSQWALYSPFIYQERYCIPINPKGWYLYQDCNKMDAMLLPKGDSMYLNWEKGTKKNRIMAVTLKNESSKIAEVDILYVETSQGQRRAQEITNSKHILRYFLIPEDIPNPDYFRFTNRNGKSIRVNSEWIDVFGSIH